MIKRIFLFKSLLIVILLHGIDPSTAQNTQVQLEGLYATSTSLPFSKYSVENAFDQNPSTIWKTPVGSGPNEGIMIYFSSPTYISKVSADFLVNESLAQVNSIEVYGDGISFWSGRNIQREISFLYIKIARTEQVQSITGDENGSKYYREKFSAIHSIGINEINIYDENEKLIKIVPPKYVSGEIKTTSNLNPVLAYGASNLMDSHKDLGWAENVKGNGIGEEITFSCDQPITINNLKIWNGYQRSPKHFIGNARLKTFEFGIKGSTLNRYTIDDSSEPVTIQLNEALTGQEFVLKVVEAYKGENYEDLVISEIRFFNNDKPIIIKTNDEENRMKNSMEKSQHTQTFLDKNFSVSMNKQTSKTTGDNHYSEYKWQSQSMTFRSNNTFVLYTIDSYSIEEYNEVTNDENYDDDKKEIIADGNWEIIEEGSDYTKIRIFGKIYSPTTSAEIYQGNVSSDNVKIFQDFLTLKKNQITGERFFDKIILKD